MRLIDADKIRYRDMSDGHVPNGVWYTFLEDIEKQPTVKAIPIEWLMKRADSDNIVQNALVRYLIELWEGEQNEHR